MSDYKYLANSQYQLEQIAEAFDALVEYLQNTKTQLLAFVPDLKGIPESVSVGEASHEGFQALANTVREYRNVLYNFWSSSARTYLKDLSAFVEEIKDKDRLSAEEVLRLVELLTLAEGAARVAQETFVEIVRARADSEERYKRAFELERFADKVVERAKERECERFQRAFHNVFSKKTKSSKVFWLRCSVLPAIYSWALVFLYSQYITAPMFHLVLLYVLLTATLTLSVGWIVVTRMFDKTYSPGQAFEKELEELWEETQKKVLSKR